MQHIKINKKTGEFQHFIDNDLKTGFCLEDTIEFFDVRHIFRHFEFVKQSGIKVTLIMTALLVMLFYKGKNIHSYFSRQLGKFYGIEGSKNPYYDLLGNENICWRSLLYLFAMRYLRMSGKTCMKEEKEKSGNTDKIKALIFDDSPTEKTGKKIEYVSKIHDHVTGRFIFGYKLLVCGYWDGDSFIPIDFSLHRERGSDLDKARAKRNKAKRKADQATMYYQYHKKNHEEARYHYYKLRQELPPVLKGASRLELEKNEKRVARSKIKLSGLRKKMKDMKLALAEAEEMVRKVEKTAPSYGLTRSERRKQYNKKRNEDSPGYQRAKEIDMNKMQSVINMLKRAVRRRFVFDYVLFDSWFFSQEILSVIGSFHKKHINLIAMVKMGNRLYQDCLDKKYKTAEELKSQYRKKVKRNRKYNTRYIKVPVLYDNKRVNLFIVKIGKSGKWRMFLTTDLEISFNKLMEIYHIRWSIEVFFKDAKQYLQLGKCQCNNFDSQIGAATICMMQYIMLLLYKKIHYGYSLGSIFDQLSSQAQEENISKYLAELFWEIVTKICTILNIDCFDLFEEIISDNDRANEILQLFSPVFTEKLAA